jgi:hypothetical protein
MYSRLKSTITAIQSFIEKIREALDGGLRAVGTFFDLTKAYDILNHRVLLDKLWAYGVRGIIYSWFESYLSERKQFVEINYCDYINSRQHKYISSRKMLRCGVPQGSVLGPLLFLIYVNDLPQTVKVEQLVLFADDMNLLIINRDEKELQHKVNKVMKKLEYWFQNNNLMINIEKTIAISYRIMQNTFPARPKITYKSK